MNRDITWRTFAHVAVDQLVVVQSCAEGEGAVLGRVVAGGAEALEVAILSGVTTGPTLATGGRVRIIDDAGRVVEALIENIGRDRQSTIRVRPAEAIEASVPRSRVHRRIGGKRLTAHLSVVRIGRAARFRVELLDLSSGGARLVCAQALTADEHLQIHLPAVAGAQGWNGSGRVVWVHPEGPAWVAGLQFVDLSTADREAIQRIVFQMRWQGEPAAARG